MESWSPGELYAWMDATIPDACPAGYHTVDAVSAGMLSPFLKASMAGKESFTVASLTCGIPTHGQGVWRMVAVT